MCKGDTKLTDWVPTTFREAVDPHHFRTNDKARKRHEAIGTSAPTMPKPPDPPAPPQASKSPDIAQMLARNRQIPGSANPGSTLLTAPGGLGMPLIGKSKLLGGG